MVHGDGEYLTNSLEDLTVRDESVDPMSERPPSLQPDSSSSSSISSSCSSPSASSAIPEAGPVFSARQTVLSKTQNAVEETLDRLFRLSAMIRKAAIHNRHAKAATFVEFDADGGNLTTVFKSLATQIVKHVFPHANEDLRERLAETISLRQRQFAYSRRHHRDKYAMKDVNIPSNKPTAEPLNIMGPRLLQLNSRGSIIEGTSRKRKFGTLSEVPTQSSASAVDPTLTPKQFPTSTPSVSSAGRTKIEVNKFVLPRPPEIRHGSKEFECPFCFIVQSESVAKEENWRLT
jgi:hypothetical protein